MNMNWGVGRFDQCKDCHCKKEPMQKVPEATTTTTLPLTRSFSSDLTNALPIETMVESQCQSRPLQHATLDYVDHCE